MHLKSELVLITFINIPDSELVFITFINIRAVYMIPLKRDSMKCELF